MRYEFSRFARLLVLEFALLLPCSGALLALAEIPGERVAGGPVVQETTDEIMARQAVSPARRPRPERELEGPDRHRLRQNPLAPAIASYPPRAAESSGPGIEPNIHTTALSFNGATLTDTGAFPPTRWVP